MTYPFLSYKSPIKLSWVWSISLQLHESFRIIVTGEHERFSTKVTPTHNQKTTSL